MERKWPRRLAGALWASRACSLHPTGGEGAGERHEADVALWEAMPRQGDMSSSPQDSTQKYKADSAPNVLKWYFHILERQDFEENTWAITFCIF